MKPKTENNSPVTIIDVANQAGVSMKTVSRVINDEPKVTAKTRERVQKAIDELGYQRNVFARGLRANRSLVLGLLYENPQGDYPADILHGALVHCRKNGYHLAVEILAGSDMGLQTNRFLSQTRLDGVLLTPPVCDNAVVLKALKIKGVPYVRISPNKPTKDEQFIGVDDFSAAQEIVQYLASVGHKRIGFIKGTPGHAATEARLVGYRKACADNNLDTDNGLVVDGDFDFTSGVEGARSLMTLEEPPTAIFACNDETGAGVLSYAHENGISVPNNLSVCGFDGGTISRVVWPRLTTIMQPIRDLGKNAVRVLIASDEEKKLQSGPVILPYKLILGDSSAMPGH